MTTKVVCDHCGKVMDYLKGIQLHRYRKGPFSKETSTHIWTFELCDDCVDEMVKFIDKKEK